MPPLSTKAVGPKEEEWEHHRPEMGRLYMEEEWPLGQVMKHMKDEYNFIAKSDSCLSIQLGAVNSDDGQKKSVRKVLCQVEASEEYRCIHMEAYQPDGLQYPSRGKGS